MAAMALTLREFDVFVDSSETASLILIKFWWNVSMIVLFKICVGFCRAPFNMAAMALTLRKFYVFVNSSETAILILTKLWWNVSMIVLF